MAAVSYTHLDVYKRQELERVRAHKGMCIVKLRGVDGMDAARAYIGKTAYFALSLIHI